MSVKTGLNQLQLVQAAIAKAIEIVRYGPMEAQESSLYFNIVQSLYPLLGLWVAPSAGSADRCSSSCFAWAKSASWHKVFLVDKADILRVTLFSVMHNSEA